MTDKVALFTRLFKSLVSSSKGHQSLATISFQDDLAAAGMVFDDWKRINRSSPFVYVDLAEQAIECLHTNAPTQLSACIRAADRITKHEFDLLGSGPYVPVDPDRPTRPSGYRPIDWSLDPVRSLRFPRNFHHKDWNPATMRPGRADIKLPWELSRCQHWACLGQAYRLSREDKYANEIAAQLDDFVEANPVGIGVNWTCTMDVALRAVNWMLGLQLIRSSSVMSEAFEERAYGALFQHGVFIASNLENTYEVTSNHFLSNVVGLYYLSVLFQALPQGKQWRDFSRAALEKEIEIQVLEDGADFESSVTYHRLVLELLIGAARLAEFNGEPFSGTYVNRLKMMVDFLLGVMRPDGLLPQVGDADDGRLHILSNYGRWKPQDARHLLAPASQLLKEPKWLKHAGEWALWEATWWGFQVDQTAVENRTPPPSFALYPQAGVAVMRSETHYVLATNGRVGTKGFGNHKHNDQLSFEYHADGVPLLVDPGSYVYTADPDARNLFRSTGYHNTLRVDDEEQNEMRPEWLFRLFEKANPVHLGFNVERSHVEYHGRHEGYRRLPSPVTHERQIRWLRESGPLLILDTLSGTGRHSIEWHFHCAPDVEVASDRQGQVELQAGGRTFSLQFPNILTVKIGDGWYSPSYGVRQACRVIDLHGHLDLSTREYVFWVIAEVLREGSRNAVDLDRLRLQMIERAKSHTL